MTVFCSIEGCERISISHGWCRKHYACWYRTGDPIARDRKERRFHENRTWRFTPAHWEKWLQRLNEPEQPAEKLVAGITDLRALLERPQDRRRLVW
jgi:hypothetical protein